MLAGIRDETIDHDSRSAITRLIRSNPAAALAALVVVSATVRLILAIVAPLGNDEAYHYLFTVHRDWSYFDHPPMTAWVEDLGLAVAGGRVSAIALRLGFIALFAGSTWLLARLTNRLFGGDRPYAGFLAALALNVTAYYGAAAATFALPDGPLLFFWLLTLDQLDRARRKPESITRWVGVGLAWGGALLSKYHAVFLPVGMFIYLLIEPSARRLFLKPGPYLAIVIGILAFSPAIYWNYEHGWASFLFQGGRAAGSALFRPDLLARAIGEQALYLLPWIWWPLVVALVHGVRSATRRDGSNERFLTSHAIVPLLLFAWVACRGRVLPHWSLIGFVSIFPLLGAALADRLATEPKRLKTKLIVACLLPVLFILAFMTITSSRLLERVKPARLGEIAASADPLLDQEGWSELSRVLRDRGVLNDPAVFLVTTRWYQSGQLAYATRRGGDIACYSAFDARGFAYWNRPEEWVGRDAILVTVDDTTTDPELMRPWFDRIDPIAQVTLERSGKRVRTLNAFRCVRQRVPFPYANVSAREIRRRVIAGRGALHSTSDANERVRK